MGRMKAYWKIDRWIRLSSHVALATAHCASKNLRAEFLKIYAAFSWQLLKFVVSRLIFVSFTVGVCLIIRDSSEKIPVRIYKTISNENIFPVRPKALTATNLFLPIYIGWELCSPCHRHPLLGNKTRHCSFLSISHLLSPLSGLEKILKRDGQR